MDKQLRDLAFAIVRSKKVETTTIDSLLSQLSTKDTKKFLSHLRTALEKNTVSITATEKTPELTSYFEKKFADMHIIHQTDDTIGGGVIVKIADDVYDYSVRNYIATTINHLNEEL
ncbi:MAG TPA: F0F1 ATP synthase subunit delta [Candidatus Levybacteria bacterium]|nr:F0F1 ATP synthase subunit delta [Candidatus Levybacteria bacterium]